MVMAHEPRRLLFPWKKFAVPLEEARDFSFGPVYYYYSGGFSVYNGRTEHMTVMNRFQYKLQLDKEQNLFVVLNISIITF